MISATIVLAFGALNAAAAFAFPPLALNAAACVALALWIVLQLRRHA